MNRVDALGKCVEEALHSLPLLKAEPQELYRPICYALASGGKRIRPLLALLVCDAFGGKVEECMPVALAHEVFHNFTLLHDDVMDNSPMRRGRPSVMKQFGVNSAILSGDAMLVYAFELLGKTDTERFSLLFPRFCAMSSEVMEGQQWDMKFEEREDVSVEEYLEMIRLKTAVLLASAACSGAIMAKASPQDRQEIYNYALNLGMAFQLQDDFLDVYGDAETFGKPIGGDILEQKKTIMYLSAMQGASAERRQQLQDAYRLPKEFAEEKIVIVRELFDLCAVPQKVEQLIDAYLLKSDACLEHLAERYKTNDLRSLGNKLRHRKA